jgi:hypothetical protein
LICFDGINRARLWTKNVGDRVTRIVPADIDGDGVEEIVCAAESANIYAFAPGGELLWRTALPGGSSDLALLPGDEPRFAAAAGAAGVLVLDAEGAIVAAGQTGERVLDLALVDGRVALTLKGGRIVAFGLAE